MADNGVPRAIVSVAAASFIVQVPLMAALPLTTALLGGDSWKVMRTMGSEGPGGLVDLIVPFVGIATAALIHVLIGRIATVGDDAQADRLTAEVAQGASRARWHYDRERLALLHDTAAATLLMVGQQATVDPDRLAAQAARDLRVLGQRPWSLPTPRIDLVEALRAEAAHLDTPAEFTGEQAVWFRGPLAEVVVAAAREVTNNVDRRAGASRITIDVRSDSVVITDDGTGFIAHDAASGHGIRASIVGWMNRVGGAGSVRSALAEGTIAELSWFSARVRESPRTPAGEVDDLVGSLRALFRFAVVGYALVRLAA